MIISKWDEIKKQINRMIKLVKKQTRKIDKFLNNAGEYSDVDFDYVITNSEFLALCPHDSYDKLKGSFSDAHRRPYLSTQNYETFTKKKWNKLSAGVLN